MPSIKGSLAGSRDRIKEAGGESLQLVADYFKQETVDPIKALGRFLTYGALGAFLMGLGTMFLLIAVLRFLQEQTGVFHGDWSWVPYLIDAVVAILVMGLAAWRITAGPATRRGAVASDPTPAKGAK